MSILAEVDEALFAAMRNSEISPKSVQFIILFNTESHNEFLGELLKMPEPLTHRNLGQTLAERRYRGAIQAVSYGETVPRVTILGFPKK